MLIVLREAKSVLIARPPHPTLCFLHAQALADRLAGMLKEVRHAQDTMLGHAPMSPTTVGGEQWTENTEQLRQQTGHQH